VAIQSQFYLYKNKMVKRDEVSLGSFEDDFFLKLILNRNQQDSDWLMILKEIQHANQKLLNYQMFITVKKNVPKYCTITFNHSDLNEFETLKKYVGEYGFVVPIKWGKETKVLKGEKNNRYNS